MAEEPHPGWRKLTRAEERVIAHQGTEAPFSGEYEHNTRAGTYVCKRCGTSLSVLIDPFDGMPLISEVN